MKNIYDRVKNGEIDINNKERFFGVLIKGLMRRLEDDINVRNIPVPHIIINTGDDIMYLKQKGYDFSKEPQEVTNENYVYGIVPRCMVKPGGIDIMPDQLTSPYSRGIFQLEEDNELVNLSAEYRRIPLKLSVELKYYTDTYNDLLELVQQMITKLCFVRTYNIVYMGQSILCSYKIPEAFSGEFLTELDGASTEEKCRTLTLSIEVETNLPVIAERTVVNPGNIITTTKWTNNIEDETI